MCPDWESNQQPLRLQDNAQPTELHPSGHYFFLKMFLLIDFREEEEKGREHWFHVPFICVVIGWFFYVHWLGIKSATLMYQDNSLANWATQPGLGNYFKQYSECYWEHLNIVIVEPNNWYCMQTPQVLLGSKDIGSKPQFGKLPWRMKCILGSGGHEQVRVPQKREWVVNYVDISFCTLSVSVIFCCIANYSKIWWPKTMTMIYYLIQCLWVRSLEVAQWEVLALSVSWSGIKLSDEASGQDSSVGKCGTHILSQPHQNYN